MSVYLLAGSRGPFGGEMGLAAAAHAVVTRSAWHGWLRRWGLLESFALPRDPANELHACLVVRVTGEGGAARLAHEWERVTGYRVTVLALATAAPSRKESC